MKLFFVKEVLLIATACLISAAAQDISLERNKPDPQQVPCPQQMIKLQCEIMVPTTTLIWALPTGEMLEFGILKDVGFVRTSSDNAYTATLTGKREDNDPDTDRFFFSSTLLILEPVNQTTLTCTGGGGADPVEKSAIITQSGTPDPPNGLSYDTTVVIKSSVDLQWTRPSYTGGVDVVNYKISSTNGTTVTVEDSSEVVQYSPGLVYGDVQVSAINTCDLESQPAVINIPAAAPPKIFNFLVEFSCDVPVESHISVRIDWMYGIAEKGVVYPGDVKVVVKLTNEHTICPDVTVADTSCAVTLPRDVYNISITQTNDIGSTVDSAEFETEVLVVAEQISLMLNTQLLLIVTVRRNRLCLETESPVLVTFGTRAVGGGGGECKSKQRAAEMVISSGDSATFFVDAASVSFNSDEAVCFIVSLDGVSVITSTLSSNASTAITTVGCSDENGLSVGAATGITLIVTLLVVVPVGVVLAGYVMHCLLRSRSYTFARNKSDRKELRVTSAVYDEPMTPVFSLTENRAYGQVAPQ